LARDRWIALGSEKWPTQIRDSKLLNQKQRSDLAPAIRAALPTAISHTAVRYIDTYNISRAIERGIYKVVQHLLSSAGVSPTSCYVLFDGKFKPVYPQLRLTRAMPELRCEIKADQKYFPVAAASIIAKVARDDMISRAAERFPGYGLEQHAGYGTQLHRSAIRELGQTKFHRKSFKIK